MAKETWAPNQNLNFKKPYIWKPQDWEAEAVDFFCVDFCGDYARIPKKDFLKFALEAQEFISKTLWLMELRPKRSLVRRQKRAKA